MYRFALATTHRALLAGSIGLAVLAAACNDKSAASSSTGANVAASGAPVVAPPVKLEATTAAGPREELAFAAPDAKVGFVGRKITGSHTGSFGKVSGKVLLVGGKAEGSGVTVEIDMASVDSDAPKLTGHLRSPDFFDVEKFPKAGFASTSIVPGGSGGATHTVSGNLTLHGVTKPVTFPATIQVAADQVTATASVTINRKDFGVVYPGKPDDLIKDEVALELSIKTRRTGK